MLHVGSPTEILAREERGGVSVGLSAEKSGVDVRSLACPSKIRIITTFLPFVYINHCLERIQLVKYFEQRTGRAIGEFIPA